MAPAACPAFCCTYRLQLHAGFGFDDAARLVPYLARLGVSHAYCSPLLRARRGSTHGYDVVDHGAINPELGGREGFDRFVAALRAHGMGLLFDVVPNHMGVFGDDNAWWMDVLENGPASAYAGYFDIEWQPADPDVAGKVLAPVLGDHYGVILERGELRLVFEDAAGAFAVRYHDHRFPVDPRDYAALLAGAGEAAAGLARDFRRLPARDAGVRARSGRERRVPALKRRLADCVRQDAAARAAIDASVAAVNADPGGALHALLERQAYRLAFWRAAADEINYRRFFDVNELAALRMEEEAVFEATHRLTLDLAAEGAIDGLRIDHPDGLHDPAQYLRRLQAGYAKRAGLALSPDADGRPARPLYIVVEKITAHHEDLPEDWAVAGTTGYRFANVLNGLFVDSSALARLDRIWRAFGGEPGDFAEQAYRGRRAIQRSALASELAMLATELLRIARADRHSRDFTLNMLREALREVAACMPVYRTYITGAPSERDGRYVEWAVAGAMRRSRDADVSILAFVRGILLGQAPAGAPEVHAARVRRFAMRFQQFTSPVAAKGVEDTAFYNYHRLVSLNEVGGDPGIFGMSVRAFHGASAHRAARWPTTMLATSTHDNKRSEDVRSRINVLSEMPAAWRLALRRWRSLARPGVAMVDGEAAPSPADEYLLYQTLMGTYPPRGLDGEALEAYRLRIEAYMLKAAREAKRHTSWISPNAPYEQALAGFVRALLGRASPNRFLDDLRLQASIVAWYGAINGIALTAIK
ncbi:MAG: malto-oligosyltrehalose synthase, partial [Betaproteobacteria bacterium]|nr:malto-oligosyltrehalose synthase [Betaproteobacteria bacterium]